MSQSTGDVAIAPTAPAAPAPGRARDVGLDALRGVAILFVVLSHALQDHAAPGGQAIYQVLWYVDMPLFMMLAGFASGYARPRPFWSQVGRRALQLLVPFAIWTAAMGLLFKSGVTLETVRQVAFNILIGRAGPWFLPALFVFDVVLLTLRKVTRRPLVLIGLAFGVMVVCAVVRSRFPGIDATVRVVYDAQKYFLYYAVGYVACTKRESWKRLLRPAAIASAFVLPAALAFKHLGGVDALNVALTAARVPGRGVMLWATGYGAQVAAGLAACTLAFAAIRALDPARLRVPAFIGSLTMGVYVIHIWLRPVIPGTGWLAVLGAFAFGTLVSLGASWAISRVPVLNTLLLGGRTAPAAKG